jgi:hypothetical protein
MLRKTTEDVCSHRDMFNFFKFGSVQVNGHLHLCRRGNEGAYLGVSSSFFPLDTMRRHTYAKRLRLEHHYPPLARRVFVFCIELRNVFSV